LDDQNAPATKGDITDLQAGLSAVNAKIEALRAETNEKLDLLRSEMNHGYADIVERIHDSQTELLKAFYSYATGNNKRVAELEGNEGAFRSRLATIEDRILEVERRLNIPPAA
jgi:predicted  nucleic acid-binding Zn-ribbon protein